MGDWDLERKVVMRYEVAPDGDVTSASVFCDLTDEAGEDAIDGIKVDRDGNLYVCGPGGVWIIDPAGKHLGTIKLPDQLMMCLFNWDDAPTTVSFPIRGSMRITDYWSGADLGRRSGSFVVEDMPPQSARLLACR